MKLQNDTILALRFTPHSISCSLLSSRASRFFLHAYKKIALSHLELEKLIIFNPTAIHHLIADFIKNHTHANVPIYCTLLGPLLKEYCFTMTSKDPSIDQFPISHSPHWQWDYTHLYTHDTHHMFYVCGIPKTILLQYQLLAIRMGLNMQQITSEHNALLHLYKKIFGNTLRDTHIQEDLQRTHASLENLFSYDDLRRMLTIPSNMTVSQHDALPLLTACGLLVSGDQR